MLKPRIRDALALSVPLALLWALDLPALSAWWVRDDPCLLVSILDHGVWRPFVQPTSSFLIPLQSFSLGVDLWLFGLDPAPFYGHQLLSFSVLIAVGYTFLRGYLTPAGSSLALCLFVASVPATAVARLLMNRHYLEGAVLALASLALYRRSVEGGRLRWAVLGAVLFLLATAAKEVFVPLVLLLPFLAGGEWRRRWRQGVPFLVAAAVYGLWRLAMLGWGNSLSGYGDLSGDFHASALERVPAMLGLGGLWQVGLGAAGAAAVLVAFARCSPGGWAALGAGLLALATPLVPVAARLEPRHLFLPAFAATALLASAVETLPAPGRLAAATTPIRAIVGLALLLWALASLTTSHFWRRLEPTVAHHRAEGGFVLDGASDGVLLTTVNHTTYLGCLARLRREVLGAPDGPRFCGDPCLCAREGAPGEPRWRHAGGRLVAAEAAADDDCDAGRPLEVEVSHDRARQRLSWGFGPYPDGTYEVLLVSGDANAPSVGIPFAVPRRGSMPYWLSEPLRLVVRYRSPDGWRTYSPTVTVEPDGRAVTR